MPTPSVSLADLVQWVDVSTVATIAADILVTLWEFYAADPITITLLGSGDQEIYAARSLLDELLFGMDEAGWTDYDKDTFASELRRELLVSFSTETVDTILQIAPDMLFCDPPAYIDVSNGHRLTLRRIGETLVRFYPGVDEDFGDYNYPNVDAAVEHHIELVSILGLTTKITRRLATVAASDAP